MKLQLLVPQYEEDDAVVKSLLDSLEIQQNVDLKNDVGVVIVNDGSNVFLSDELLHSYTFPIDYYKEEHRGVSGTRNSCLDHAVADYVMFCDADDMFYNVCGLYLLFREIDNEPFNALISVFVEETRTPDRKEIVYVNHEMDTTFVHGKVYRRRFLINKKVRWNENLTIHEDSYFNCLAQKMTADVKYCPVPFYLWKWRDASVCRHDPKYILKTYNNMLESNTCLVNELIKRSHKDDAKFYATSMIYDAYFTMNKDEWISQENQEYRSATEKRFKQYYLDFEDLFESLNKETKTQIVAGIRQRFYAEGLLMESITFEDWIKHVLETY